MSPRRPPWVLAACGLHEYRGRRVRRCGVCERAATETRAHLEGVDERRSKWSPEPHSTRTRSFAEREASKRAARERYLAKKKRQERAEKRKRRSVAKRSTSPLTESMQPLPPDFMASVAVARSGCWLWMGARSSTGYGTVRIDGRTVGAHRHAFELAHRRKIRCGMVIRHRCDQRACVNPEHLEEGTTRQNALDRADAHRGHGQRKRPAGRKYW